MTGGSDEVSYSSRTCRFFGTVPTRKLLDAKPGQVNLASCRTLRRMVCACALVVMSCASDERPSSVDKVAQREADLLAELETRENKRRAALRKPFEVQSTEWQALMRRDPEGLNEVCAIVSGSRVIDRGEAYAVARVVVVPGGLYLEGGAPLDLKALDSGFLIDAGIPLPFDELADPATAKYPVDGPALLDRLADAAALVVRFAYAEREIGSAPEELVFELDGFVDALADYRQCVKS